MAGAQPPHTLLLDLLSALHAALVLTFLIQRYVSERHVLLALTRAIDLLPQELKKLQRENTAEHGRNVQARLRVSLIRSPGVSRPKFLSLEWTHDALFCHPARNSQMSLQNFADFDSSFSPEELLLRQRLHVGMSLKI